MFRQFLPHTLLSRSLLILITPLILMQVFTAYVFYESHWDQVIKRLASALAGEVVLLVESVSGMPDAASREWLLQAAARRLDLTATVQPDEILPNRPKPATDLESEIRRALSRRQLTKPMHVDERSVPNMIVISVQLPDGVLRVVAPRSRLFTWTTPTFVLWTIGTTLILLGLATLFMRKQIRPVRRLASVAEAFGKGRDVPYFRPEGAREVRQAGVAFIAMRNRIQRQINQRTTMLAGVSHDLRTPLARMKLELEMMPPSEEVEALREDVLEMERMLAGYLSFARGEGTETPKPCDIRELLQEAVRQARRKGGEIQLSTEGDLQLPVRPQAFMRCINNLLDNAMQHARHVAVRARRVGGNIDVVIDDDGPGIAAEQREEVFKPFYRIEGSRNPQTGGVGLGLSIARDVVRGHGGDILLDQSPAGGLRVRLRLPV
jgi:two-component system osmolarity sensor histidine kinase EnvZ